MKRVAMQEFDGEITITRTNRSDGPDTIHITVDEEKSTCRAIEIDISLEEFARALFNLSFRPCRFRVNTSGVLGKQREHKREIVTVPRYPWGTRAEDEKAREKIIAKAMKPFEVDGWKGRHSDAENSHNVRGRGESLDNATDYEVSFERFVDA